MVPEVNYDVHIHIVLRTNAKPYVLSMPLCSLHTNGFGASHSVTNRILYVAHLHVCPKSFSTYMTLVNQLQRGTT